MKAFLSHSSVNKALVARVHEALTPHASWLDRAEIEWGDLFLEKIAKGIEEATDFVLFWSAPAAKSEWVRLELHMAFIRMLRERAIRLRVVVLDRTPLPLYLQPFHILDASDSADQLNLILQHLKRVLEEPTEAQRHWFLNRNSELQRIENTIDDATTSLVLLAGFQGIGKRSLAEEAFRRFFSGAEYIIVDVTSGMDLTQLALKLNAYVRAMRLPESLSHEQLLREVMLSLEAMARSKRFLILTNIQHWLDEDSHPVRPLSDIIQIAQRLPDFRERPILATSTRRIDHTPDQSGVTSIFIDGLSNEHIATLIRQWHQITEGKQLSHEDSLAVAKELYGLPLAAKQASYLIGQFGVKFLQDNPHYIIKLRRDLARFLLMKIPLSAQARSLVGCLSITRSSIPITVLCEVFRLGEYEFHDAVDQASRTGVLIPGSALQVHPLFIDFFWKQQWDAQDYKPTALALANAIWAHARKCPTESPEFVDLLPVAVRLFALAGEFDKARNIRADLIGELLDAAIAHYNRRNYPLAQTYIEHVLAVDPTNWRARLYRARILIRGKKWSAADELLTEMLRERPSDKAVRHAQGWRYLQDKNYERALSIFLSIIAESDHVRSLRDAAECLHALKRGSEALRLLERAKAVESDNPFTLELEARILEEMERLPEAFDALSLAILRDPTRWAFQHRLGRIRVQQGRKSEAIQHFRDAMALDAEQFTPAASLVSALLDSNAKPAEVRRELEAMRRVSKTSSNVEILRNLEARCLKAEGRLKEAVNVLEEEIRNGRNLLPNYGVLAEARYDQYIMEREKYPATAEIYLEQAKKALGQGLGIEPQNPILLSLRDRIR